MSALIAYMEGLCFKNIGECDFPMVNREQILTRGHIDMQVRVGGILQKHRLTVEKEKTAFGKVVYLSTKVNIPNGELVRMVEELQLPIKTPQGKIFPRGKGPWDFPVSSL
jgi:hypothetical protein